MNEIETALSQERRARLLLDAISDYAIYMLSPDGRVASWNSGASRFMGYSAAEIVGGHFSQFYIPEDRAQGLPERALQVAEAKGRLEGEGWRLRKDGSRFWANVVLDPIWGPERSLIGFAKVTRDLTERREAEAALFNSQEQFRRLVEGVADYAIYMLTPEGKVANWNTGAARIKGYSREEIVGQHFSRFYTPEDRENGEPEHALATAIKEGRFEREAWRVRKDGTRFLAHVVIDPIRDGDGTLLGFAKITRDVTERAAHQKSLEAAREQLYQSQKLEAIGQLTGGIAHDFNNLLMVVLSSLELAEKRLPKDDRQLAQLIGNAAQAARRGATLTSRLLAFARRQDLSPRPTNLIELIIGMNDLLTRSIGPSIQIETQFADELPLAKTDPSQLETAILNLVVNARDAMPGGGKIVISAMPDGAIEAGDDAQFGEYVKLSVSDTGAGMDPETLAKATEPFFTTKGVGKGTGLGLSMVHGLTQQSGGHLKIESQVGVGSTVTIRLPVAANDATELLAVVEQATDGKVTPRVLTIVAVDGDALILMNTKTMLEDMGHTVHDATSGVEALQLLETRQVDLVITDHAMPRMTGLQLADAIKLRWPETSVILATGYAEIPAGEESTIPRLAKPFSQQDLEMAVAKWASVGDSMF